MGNESEISALADARKALMDLGGELALSDLATLRPVANNTAVFIAIWLRTL